MLLTAGAAFAQNARIVLRWKDVPGASAYELQISRDANFTEIVLQTRTTVPGYRWEQLPTRTHWWRVRSIDAEGRPSEWSQPRTVEVESAVPVPLRPGDGAIVPCGHIASFDFEPNPLIREFQLEVSSAPDFSSVRSQRGSSASVQMQHLGPGTWYWRARSVDVKQKLSEWGPVRSFVVRVMPPRLKPVPDLIIGAAQVSLGWSPSGCAASYIVEVSNDGQKSSTAAQGTSLPLRLSGGGEYRWRVAAVDEHQVSGEFSPENVFRVRLPTPTGLSETVTSSVLFGWAAVPTAVAYDVEVQRMTEARAEEALRQSVSRNGAVFPELTPGEYRWRVAARDAEGHASVPSDYRYFVRSAGAPLATPTWVSPPDDAVVPVGAKVTLGWQSDAESTLWDVELDGQVQRSPQPALVTEPLPEGTHRFRVRALGPGFRVSEWTTPRQVFAGRPSVERVELSRSGNRFSVQLFDAKNRRLVDVEPRFFVERGALAEPVHTLEGWDLEWTPPPVGEDVLHVEERDFSWTKTVVEQLDPVGSFALRAGGVFNGGGVRSFDGGLGLGLRLPFLQRHLGLELRAAIYQSSGHFETAGTDFQAQAWMLPLTLMLAWHQSFNDFGLRGGVGPALQFAWLDVAGERSTALRPGLEVAVAGSYRLGPGRVEVEVGFLWSYFATERATWMAGGASVRAGYVFEF